MVTLLHSNCWLRFSILSCDFFPVMYVSRILQQKLWLFLYLSNRVSSIETSQRKKKKKSKTVAEFKPWKYDLYTLWLFHYLLTWDAINLILGIKILCSIAAAGAALRQWVVSSADKILAHVSLTQTWLRENGYTDQFWQEQYELTEEEVLCRLESCGTDTNTARLSRWVNWFQTPQM